MNGSDMIFKILGTFSFMGTQVAQQFFLRASNPSRTVSKNFRIFQYDCGYLAKVLWSQSLVPLPIYVYATSAE